MIRKLAHLTNDFILKKCYSLNNSLKKVLNSSLVFRCLHSYNAVNLNEMSFKTGDILHITDTRYNYDPEHLTWTWYGVKKVSASKQCEGEIPAIET